MAIQFRRGAYPNFDPSKMLPGEPAVCLSGDPHATDGKSMYMAFAAGDVKRMATVDDAATIAANAVEELTDEVDATIAASQTATRNAQAATTAANNATATANDASERAEAAIEAIGEISVIAVPLMSADTRGGAKLGSGLAITEGKLHTQLVQGGQGIANTAMQADGDLLHGLTVDGMSVQDGTPTPSAPVPIQVIETANLHHQDYYEVGSSHTSAGITWTYNADGTWTANGTATANSWAIVGQTANPALSQYVTLLPGTYTANAGGGYYAIRKVVNGEVITFKTTTNTPYTFTLEEQTLMGITPVVQNGTTVTNAVLWATINKGTTPQPYVPYGSLGLKVRGRNLLSLPPASINIDGGVLFKNNGNNSYTISGTATRNTYIYLTNNSSNFQLPAGTYTISALDKNGNTVPNVNVGASRWVNGSNTNYGSAPGIKTFTHTGEGNVQLLVSVNANKTVVKSTVYVQLETGSEATAFVPYVDSTTPIPLQSNVLASLPDGTRDELAVDELGRVKIVKRVASVVFDGSEDENWSGYNYTHGHGYYTGIPNPSVSANANAAVSTGFTCVQSNGYAYDGNFYVSVSSSNWALNFVYETPADVAAWRTYLAANPLTVYYRLATPITIDLGTIDPPALADGATLEILANLDTGVSADWWAVGAGAVGDGLVALRDLIATVQTAVAEISTQ